MTKYRDIEPIISLPFFFILGRPRSGTTLLRTILDAHPDIKIPPENGNLIHLWFKYRHIATSWNEHRIDAFLKDFAENRAVKAFWKTDFAMAREILLSGRGRELSFPDIIKIIYYCCESPFPKNEIRILGDKSPIHSLYGRELRLIFPGARFIHLIRDYRANLASMSNHDIFPAGVSTIVLMWNKSAKQIGSLSRRYPAQYIMVRYEDFVSEPVKYTAEICRFLEVPFMPSILDTTSRNDLVGRIYDPGYIREWQPDLTKEISTGNIHKWKEKLTRNEILKSEFLAGKTGEEMGYQQVNYHFGVLFRLKCVVKKLNFGIREMQRHLFDRFPYSWKIRIRDRRFIPSKEVILLYKRIFGN